MPFNLTWVLPMPGEEDAPHWFSRLFSYTPLVFTEAASQQQTSCPCSYGDVMITYSLIFWNGSYFIKDNYSFPFRIQIAVKKRKKKRLERTSLAFKDSVSL